VQIVDENTPPLIQKKRGRKTLYKWDDFLKHNKTIRLTRGEDYHVPTESFLPQVYNAARRRNGTVSVTRGEDILDRDVLDVTFTFNESYFRKQSRAEAELSVPEDDADIDDKIVHGKWGPPLEEEDLFPQGIAKARRED